MSSLLEAGLRGVEENLAHQSTTDFDGQRVIGQQTLDGC